MANTNNTPSDTTKAKDRKKIKLRAPKQYLKEVETMVVKEYGYIPPKLVVLIRKTAQDMRMLDRISAEIEQDDDLTTIETGSTGQIKTVVNPLIPYYDKYSSRVTDDLYNLGLTARKQAAKTDDPGKKKEDPLSELINTLNE